MDRHSHVRCGVVAAGTMRQFMRPSTSSASATNASSVPGTAAITGSSSSNSNPRATTALPPQLPTERAIIHLDMDCFFAAASVVDYPVLRGKPLVVCHSSSAQGTGEVGVQGEGEQGEFVSVQKECFSFFHGWPLQQKRGLSFTTPVKAQALWQVPTNMPATNAAKDVEKLYHGVSSQLYERLTMITVNLATLSMPTQVSAANYEAH
eukprot:1158396-Pelagomonas_calceolata.AAC.18